MKHIIYCALLSLLCFSCENEDKSDIAYISLDQTKVTFEYSGGSVKVKLLTNGEWKANDIPDWIILNHINGKASTEITITVTSNETRDPKEAEIIFVRENQKAILKISQAKMEKELAWSSLCFSSFDNVSFTVGKDDKERTYTFTTRQLFINPDANTDIKEKIFLGNLINRNLDNNTDVSVYEGYTFNPITAFPSVGLENSQIFVPSKTAQDVYANQIISKKPTQSEIFALDGKGVVYNSHRELNLIGVGNMGIPLDEIVAEKPYKEQEMVKNNGIIYSFSHTLFTLNMDLQEHIVKEEIDKKDFPNNSLSYVSGVSYGRIGLLIIESDYDVTKLRRVINKILQTKPEILEQEDTAILNELNAYHLYYDKSQKLKVTKGKVDAIIAYKTQITEDIFNVFPFRFTVSDYFEQGDTSMTFNVILP